tara:strand:- start:566 stop:754 length:189 start_codon:yes stop_codon:yes gene_type:complete
MRNNKMKDIIQFYIFKFKTDPVWARKFFFLNGRSFNKTALMNILINAMIEEDTLLLPEKTTK